MEQVIIPYSKARLLIEEADLLIFRSKPWNIKDLLKFEFPSIGWWISTYTSGPYSHIGLAHWDDGHLNLVEMREFRGGREVRLSGQVKRFPFAIDVYKAVPKIYEFSLDQTTLTPKWVEIYLDGDTRKNITETALQLTGSKYGWGNIFRIIRGYTPFFRLVYNKYDLKDRTDIYVCSTLASYAYKIHYADPCYMIPDDLTSPNDVAKSSLFRYGFTIGDMDLTSNE